MTSRYARIERRPDFTRQMHAALDRLEACGDALLQSQSIEDDVRTRRAFEEARKAFGELTLDLDKQRRPGASADEPTGVAAPKEPHQMDDEELVHAFSLTAQLKGNKARGWDIDESRFNALETEILKRMAQRRMPT